MESKIDFRKLKLSIPIEKVLAHYGVQVRRTTGSQLVADCPLHSHTSKESRNSLKLNAEKNVWCCMSESCVAGFTEKLGGKRGGDVLDLVALKEGVTILQAAKLLLEWFPQNGRLQRDSKSGERERRKERTLAVRGGVCAGREQAAPVRPERHLLRGLP